MRLALALLIAVALAGCGREPSFDERFDETAGNIEERARAIDQELNSENAAADQ